MPYRRVGRSGLVLPALSLKTRWMSWSPSSLNFTRVALRIHVVVSAGAMRAVSMTLGQVGSAFSEAAQAH
jgi:hypothetical protein